MCKLCGRWAIVDWRPFQTPEVFGPYHDKNLAVRRMKEIFKKEFEENADIASDEIFVTQMQNDWDW